MNKCANGQVHQDLLFRLHFVTSRRTLAAEPGRPLRAGLRPELAGTLAPLREALGLERFGPAPLWFGLCRAAAQAAALLVCSSPNPVTHHRGGQPHP